MLDQFMHRLVLVFWIYSNLIGRLMVCVPLGGYYVNKNLQQFEGQKHVATLCGRRQQINVYFV